MSIITPGRLFNFSDAASGTFPVGHLIVNLTEGGLKRHAGSHSWEIQVGVGASAKVGFHRSTPTAQRVSADQAVAPDLASVILLASELRAVLLEKGLIKGAS